MKDGLDGNSAKKKQKYEWNLETEKEKREGKINNQLKKSDKEEGR